MKKIIQLDESTINKIAAGEVIERPASVVKELIENSIDAQATEIVVELAEGGIEKIKVRDNGIGMSREDARNSFKLHTTSKIKNIEDLEKIYTFGFRGEALASVASVSETIIHTNEGTEPIKLTIENGVLKKEEFENRTQGTTIEVNDLFRHLPARKKFLHSPTTEYRHILNELTKIAISYPEIELKLVHNDRTILALKKNNLENRLKELFKEIHDPSLIPLEIDSPIAKIKGFLTHPSITLAKPEQWLFLNKRFIIDRTINKAVRTGYTTTMPKDQNPSYFLFLEIDPAKIDINIHPRKLEAKIDRINEIFAIIKNGIEKTLDNKLKENLIEKVSNFSQQSYPITEKSYESRNTNTFKSFSPKSTSGYSNRIDLKPQTHQIQASLKFTENLLNRREEEPQTATNNYYQLFDTYILIDKGNELQVIDQHAADERINFERIYAKLNKGEMIEKRDLLIPIILDLSPTKFSILEQNIETLAKFGLDIDIFGESKIKINSIPEFAREMKHTELIDELTKDLEEGNNTQSPEFIEKIAASVACHGSIRAGRQLSQSEMQKIVTDLLNTKTPYSCPHGRPIIWTITKTEIEKKFKRIK